MKRTGVSSQQIHDEQFKEIRLTYCAHLNKENLYVSVFILSFVHMIGF